MDTLLNELRARLPELEWKISSLGTALSTKSLPAGIFRSRLEMTASTCIAEIKTEINALAAQKNSNSAYYLAHRIQQKINILVTLCHVQTNKTKPEEKVNFGVEMMATRQQWLNSLEQEIIQLTAQQAALTRARQQMQKRANSNALLQLQIELGEVEKRLTLAKETFAKA